MTDKEQEKEEKENASLLQPTVNCNLPVQYLK